MRKSPASQSGIFTPRLLLALALCSCGVLMGMFGLAATPLSEPASGAEPTARSESSPNRKPGAQFSPGGQSDPSSSNPNTGYPPPDRKPSGLDAGFAETPRAPEAASDWSIVNSPNGRPTPTDNFPSGVICVSASDCWAVGYYLNG